MSVVDQAAVLGIFLSTAPTQELRIGSLLRDGAGAVSFIVDDAYIALGQNRPIVSMAWRGADEAQTLARLQRRDDKIMRGGLLPPYFQNLLPEGALRELVEKEFGTGAFDDFDVLARLGRDLPGAIVARLEAGDAGVAKSAERESPPSPPTESGVKFSLAGIQLKFSMKAADRDSVTAPGKDAAGDVILKTPSTKYRHLPEAEYSALRLAAAAGIRTAEAWLVECSRVDGIPLEFLKGGEYALAMRRFDRAPGQRRIHTEDFAQIVGAIGDRKYTMANQETVMNMVRRFASDRQGELLESVRRVVCDIMIGNGDAHLKNWSFLYKDGVNAELSPAYDIVPTFLYGDQSMALAFGGTRNPAIIGLHRFERAAGLLKVDPKLVVKEAKETVGRVLDTWPKMLAEMPVPDPWRKQIADRWRSLQLVREVRPILAEIPDTTVVGPTHR